MNEIDTSMTMKEYLFASGILERGTKEEIADAKKDYRREYLRRKKEEHRTKNRTISLSFPNIYAEYLESKAIEYHMQIPTFLKACINGYLEQVYIIPDEKNIKGLETALNRIGNNINQLVRHCHRLSLDPTKALGEIHAMLGKMDEQIGMHLRYPNNLETIITQTLQKQPEYKTRLQRILEQYSYAPENDPTPRQEHQKLTTLHD